MENWRAESWQKLTTLPAQARSPINTKSSPDWPDVANVGLKNLLKNACNVSDILSSKASEITVPFMCLPYCHTEFTFSVKLCMNVFRGGVFPVQTL